MGQCCPFGIRSRKVDVDVLFLDNTRTGGPQATVGGATSNGVGNAFSSFSLPYSLEPHAHIAGSSAAHDFYPFPASSGGGGTGAFVPGTLSHGSHHSASTSALNKPQPRNKKALDIVAPPAAAHTSAAAAAAAAAAVQAAATSQTQQTQSVGGANSST